MFKKLTVLSVLFFSFAPVASAHSVVKPTQVGVGAFQTFTLGVPSEKPMATTAVRLLIPEGLNHVTPNVKPGWKIEIRRDLDGNVTEIIWTDGSIPAEQRDEFSFSAQVPKDEKTINWMVHQTYADGTKITWDQDPKTEQPKTAEGEPDFSKVGPLSQTKIVNDLSTKETTVEKNTTETKADNSAKTLSIVAMALAIIALARSNKKSKK